MYLYFFDIDDTICHTKIIIEDLSAKHNIYLNQFENKNDFYIAIDLKIKSEIGYHNLPLFNNNTLQLLKHLLKTNSDAVYYITARNSELRDASIQWLKKYNLWLTDERLIMDTHGKKGQIINSLLKDTDKFAFLFDDMLENHQEANQYKHIITCLPN